MVLGAFPIGKIIVLGIKQITHPISQVIKIIAKENILFKKILCIPAGQFINVVEARLKLYMLELPQPKRVPPLSDTMATDLGSKLIAELSVLGISLFLIYLEVAKQYEKDQKRHNAQKQQREELKIEMDALHKLLDWQDKEIKEMYRQLES